MCKIATLFLFIICFNFSYSQSENSLVLKIESNCICNYEKDSITKGKLKLYASKGFEMFEKNDSLFWNIDLDKSINRIDSVYVGNYMLEYIPADTSLLPSHKIIYFINGVKDIYLDCYFFNLEYTPFSTTLKDGESITFYSPTIVNPFITRTGLEIVSYKRIKFESYNNTLYASYSEGVEREGFFNPFSFHQIIPESKFKKVSQTPNGIKLEKADVNYLVEFEKNLKTAYFVYRQTSEWKESSIDYILSEGMIFCNIDENLIVKLKKELWKNQ